MKKLSNGVMLAFTIIAACLIVGLTGYYYLWPKKVEKQMILPAVKLPPVMQPEMPFEAPRVSITAS